MGLKNFFGLSTFLGSLVDAFKLKASDDGEPANYVPIPLVVHTSRVAPDDKGYIQYRAGSNGGWQVKTDKGWVADNDSVDLRL